MRALLVVDLQNDFIAGGSLAIHDGEQVIPVIDKLLKLPFDVKVATKDWHPRNHGSFAVNHPGRQEGDVIIMDGIQQILWPAHCVQNTHGSEFAPGWDFSLIDKTFYKGTEENIDSYSTFFDNEHRKSTGLADFLKSKKVKEVYIAGLATDYCVKYSVIDARKLGFKTYVVIDGCRAVNLKSEDEQQAITEMKNCGAMIITSTEVATVFHR